MTENEIATVEVDSPFQVLTRLGPRLLESVYEAVLAHELKKRGHRVERQVPVPIVYGEIRFDNWSRADLIVEDRLIALFVASLGVGVKLP